MNSTGSPSWSAPATIPAGTSVTCTVSGAPTAAGTVTATGTTGATSDSTATGHTATKDITVSAHAIAVDDTGVTTVNGVLHSSSPDTGQSVNNSSVLTNDTGVGITLLTVSGTGSACGVFPCSIATNHGSAVVSGDGAYDYYPATNYSGIDSFSYTISGGATAGTVHLTVQASDVTVFVTPPTYAAAGGSVGTQIVFSNGGAISADGLVYSVSLPAGLTGVRCDGATCSYTKGTVAIAGLPGSLSSGQNQKITLYYVAPSSGSVAMIATIATTSNQGVNSLPDSAAGNTLVTGSATTADVTAGVMAPAVVNPGGSVDVAVSYQNLGPAAAEGVSYTLTLPGGLSGVSCTGDTTGCTYDTGSGVVTMTGLPTTLPGGSTEYLTLSYTAPGSGSVTVAATVGTSTSQGLNAAPDSAGATTAIASGIVADLTTTIASPAVFRSGSTVTVPVTFSNLGRSVAAGVVYALSLPPGLSGVVCSVVASSSVGVERKFL